MTPPPPAVWPAFERGRHKRGGFVGQLPRLAWRNLGRNRRRTIITGSALAFGVALSVASNGLTDGMAVDLLDTLTRSDLGHVQLHHPDFPKTRSLEHTVEAGPLLLAARGTPGVTAATPRVYGYALASTARSSHGVEVVGIDPATEPAVTVLDRRLVGGSYLPLAATPWPRGRSLTPEEKARDQALTEAAVADAMAELEALDDSGAESPSTRPAAPETARPGSEEVPLGRRAETQALADALSPRPQAPIPVLIGRTLAKNLGAGVGDSLHATAPTLDGAREEVDLSIVGIFSTGSPMLDRGRVFVHYLDAQRLFHLAGVSEIALAVEDPAEAGEIAKRLQANVGEAILVRDWASIRPDIEQLLRLYESSSIILVVIVLIVAVLGVVNTMLMAVFDRTREIGMLKAVGMSARQIVALILTETAFLVAVACAIGTVIGLGLDFYFMFHGLDATSLTEGYSVGGVGASPVFKAAITFRGVTIPTVFLLIACLLAALYPAIKAARLEPAAGMRDV